MNRKFIAGVLLALGFVAALMVLFSPLPVFLGSALAALVTALVILVRRHLYVLPGGAARGVTVAAVQRAAAEAPLVAAEASAPEPELVPEAGAPVLDSSLFSRFQNQLATAEKDSSAQVREKPRAGEPARAAQPAPAAKPAPPPVADTPEDVQDQVSLSGQAKRPQEPAEAPLRVSRPAPPEPDTGALFADLVPEPPPRSVNTRDPFAAGRQAFAGAAPGTRETADSAPQTPKPPADDGATMLRLAEEGLRTGDLKAAQAALEQHLGVLAEAGTVPGWQAFRLGARLALLHGDEGAGLEQFDKLLQFGWPLEVERAAPLADFLLEGVAGDTATLRVSMFLKIMAKLRESGLRQAMDGLYSLVREAQEEAGNETRLLQFLKNHLQIRRVLNDLPGQLELIDLIGQRCYKLGLTEEAREYYEMGLQLKQRTEAAAAAPPDPSPPPEPAPETTPVEAGIVTGTEGKSG